MIFFLSPFEHMPKQLPDNQINNLKPPLPQNQTPCIEDDVDHVM